MDVDGFASRGGEVGSPTRGHGFRGVGSALVERTGMILSKMLTED